MSFEVRARKGAWEVVLTDEPPFVHALAMAPSSLEPELNSGTWLVVAFPVWSHSAIVSVHAAMDCAKEYQGAFQLGIRPFDAFQEFQRWWPSGHTPNKQGSSIHYGSQATVSSKGDLRITVDPRGIPRWLGLREGSVVYSALGQRSLDDLKGLADRLVKKAPAPRTYGIVGE